MEMVCKRYEWYCFKIKHTVMPNYRAQFVLMLNYSQDMWDIQGQDAEEGTHPDCPVIAK